MGEQGLILRTTDGGAGWQSVASGVEDGLRSVSFSGVNGISGGDSQTILYSTDCRRFVADQSKLSFSGAAFPARQMLSPTTGFVAGQNSNFHAVGWH